MYFVFIFNFERGSCPDPPPPFDPTVVMGECENSYEYILKQVFNPVMKIINLQKTLFVYACKHSNSKFEMNS